MMRAVLFKILACLTAAALAAAPGASFAGPADAKGGVESTPLLGWSSWSFIRERPTAENIRAQAAALHRSGLQELGYRYVNLDDFWYECPDGGGPNVDAYGRWVVDASKFPARNGENGIQALAGYVHGLGLKFGIYLTPGVSKRAVAAHSRIKGTTYTVDQIAEPGMTELNYNCKGMVAIDFSKPGAQAYINSWADMFASWGVDFVKLDGIGNNNVADIEAWSRAIGQSGRRMALDITDGIFTTAIMPTLVKDSTQWEMLPDIECYDCEKNGSSFPLTSWANLEKRFQWASQLQQYAGPGHYNDYDSIEVGNGENDGLTPDERKTQLSLWAMAAAPLILGVDLTHLDAEDLGYLKNKAVLAVDQDGIAAQMVANYHEDGPRVFAKTEKDGSVIIGMFNLASTPQEVSIQASVVGLHPSHDGYALTDLWTGHALEAAGPMITATVPAHGVVMYRAVARDAPAGH